jgi:hypothetical protein
MHFFLTIVNFRKVILTFFYIYNKVMRTYTTLYEMEAREVISFLEKKNLKPDEIIQSLKEALDICETRYNSVNTDRVVDHEDENAVEQDEDEEMVEREDEDIAFEQEEIVNRVVEQEDDEEIGKVVADDEKENESVDDDEKENETVDDDEEEHVVDDDEEKPVVEEQHIEQVADDGDDDNGVIENEPKMRRRISSIRTQVARIIEDEFEEDVGLFSLDQPFTFRLSTNVIMGLKLAIEDTSRPLPITTTTGSEMVSSNRLQLINNAINTVSYIRSDAKLITLLLRFEQWLHIMDLFVDQEQAAEEPRSLKKFFNETMDLYKIQYPYKYFIKHDRYLALVEKFGMNVLLEKGKWIAETVWRLSNGEFQELMKSTHYPGSDIFEVLLHRNEWVYRSFPQVRRVHDKLKLRRTTDAIHVLFINDRFGFGVFATRFIRKKTVIGIYIGEEFKNEVIHDKYLKDNERKGIVDKNGMRRGKRVIDATYFGTRTKFVNHSSEGFNCEAVQHFYNGVRQICFITISDIPDGHQLFIDYGDKEMIGEFTDTS